tara:strand:+ start:196 stop:903 length:708 start_codon:yes stop_codon:yes gene_type:complete
MEIKWYHILILYIILISLTVYLLKLFEKATKFTYKKKLFEKATKFTYKKKFLFIHIPKTGGTSFREIFFNFKYIDHFNCLNHSYKNENKKKITIVRNPYDRCLSAYLYLKKGGMKNDLDLNYQKKLLKYNTFKDFLIDLNILTNKEKKIIHLVPQYKFIEDDSGILVDKILYLENIDNDIKKLCKELNIKCPPKFLKKNTNKHKDYKTYYDKETQDLVYNFYKRDFELLGYSYNL